MNLTERLSDQQIEFFRTFGFLSFPGLLQDRVESIVGAFEKLFEMHGGGHNGQGHDGTQRSCILPFIDQSDYLSSLLDDPRIDGIAATLLGDDYNYMGSDGNYYVGNTWWHRDGYLERDFKHLKIAFYLDPVTSDSGALRVIPGSHLLDDRFGSALTALIPDSDRTLGMSASQLPSVALETQPGDIVCFDHNTFHASFGGGSRRRMFTINYSQRYPEERLGDLRDYIGTYARFWTARVYGEPMMHTAGPQRLPHLEQIMANDSHLAELSRRARETMTEPSRF